MEATATAASDLADERTEEVISPTLLLRPRPAVRIGHAVEALAAFALLVCCALVYLYWLAPAEAAAAAAQLDARFDAQLAPGEADIEWFDEPPLPTASGLAVEHAALRALLTAGIATAGALSALFALWSLWAALPGNRRETLRLAEGTLEWRPFIGRRRLIPLADLAETRDRRRWWGARRWVLVPRRGPRAAIPPRLFRADELDDLRRRVVATVE